MQILFYGLLFKDFKHDVVKKNQRALLSGTPKTNIGVTSW